MYGNVRRGIGLRSEGLKATEGNDGYRCYSRARNGDIRSSLQLPSGLALGEH